MEKPSIDVYVGAPIDVESEQAFLTRLRSDFESRGEDAVIFANFTLPPKHLRQIDFLVVTGKCACLVELKNFTAPVRGSANGRWALRLPDGTWRDHDATNPYQQALQRKYDLGDAMAELGRKVPALPAPPAGKRYVHVVDAAVCVFPRLLPGSQVSVGPYVQILGYEQLLERLCARPCSPGWTREQWRQVAMHISLQCESAPSTEVGPATAKTVLDEYRKRFNESHVRDLQPLCPTAIRTADGELSPDQAIESILRRVHIQIIGKPGSGKTHLVKHLALRLLDQSVIPLYCQARTFRGDFEQWLNSNIAHLYSGSAAEILSIAPAAGHLPLLVIDGLNECAPAHRPTLLQGAQACSMRWGAPVITCSHEEFALPDALKGQTWRIGDPSPEERRKIIEVYSGHKPSDAQMELFEPFSTPFELGIAAECQASSPSPLTRAGLFDAYVHAHCSRTSEPLLLRRVLGILAARMHEDLALSLPIGDAYRTISASLAPMELPPALIEAVPSCPLVSVSQRWFSFRHQLIQDFLAAEDFCRRFPTPQGFALELKLPANASLVEFAIGLQKSPQWIRAGLETTADAVLVMGCTQGKLGEAAKEIASADARELLRKANASLAALTLAHKEDGDSKAFGISWHVDDGVEWSPYERCLMSVLGRMVVQGTFTREVFSLLRETDLAWQRLIAQDPDARRAPGIASQVFASIYTFQSLKPAGAILQSISNSYRRDVVPDVLHWLSEAHPDPTKMTPGELYLACSIFKDATDDHHTAMIPRLVSASLRTGIYHLSLEALQLSQLSASKLQGTPLEEMKNLLGGFQTRNLFLSSTLVEAMTSYDMVESPVSAERAAEEIEETLRTPEDHAARQVAAGIVSNIFEDVFQGVYYQAVEALPEAKRVQLLTMAALGCARNSFSADWILERLVESNDQAALPAFLHWATSIDTDSISMQSAAACFIAAHAGAARFCDEPPVPAQMPNDDHKAWQAYGEIFFWLQKPGLSSEEIIAKCAPLWKRLRTSLPFEAVDPLRHFYSARRGIASNSSEAAVGNIFKLFADPIAELLVFGLENSRKTSTIFRRLGSYVQKENAQFCVQMLGQVGGSAHADLLRKRLADPDLGRDAVEALKEINSRVRS